MIEFKLTIENQRSFNLCTCEELRKVSLCFAFSKSFKFDAYNTCENATSKTQHYDGWMRRWKQACFKGNTKWAVYGALHRLREEKKKKMCWLQFCEFHGLFVFPSWILSEGDASWFWQELDKQRLKIPLFWGKLEMKCTSQSWIQNGKIKSTKSESGRKIEMSRMKIAKSSIVITCSKW